MRLNPAATKASSNLKDVRSSTVQPKTFPPNASGATSNPELPKLRLLISFGGPRFSNRAIISIKTPAKLGVDAFLNRTHVRAAHDVCDDRPTTSLFEVWMMRPSVASHSRSGRPAKGTDPLLFTSLPKLSFGMQRHIAAFQSRTSTHLE